MMKENQTQEFYYGQHGEDFLLSRLFADDDKDGFFVEVGCIDGKVFSNSLKFEELGWKGLCIEAHPDFIERLRVNRPNSTVIHAAVGEQDKDFVDFYANARGSLSTLEKDKSEKFSREFGKWFTGAEIKKVPLRTLDSIFLECDVEQIDILSLDIEGNEVNALKGLSLGRYQPRVIIVECDSRSERRQIEAIVLPYGYHYITSISSNLIYSLDAGDRKKIAHKRFNHVPLKHFGHPVDGGADKLKQITLSTRFPALTLHVLKYYARKLIGIIRR